MGQLEINLTSQILAEEKLRENLYPEMSISDQIRLEELKEEREKNKNEIIEIEKVLGRIVDKRELADRFIQECPIYYDDACNWWMWDFTDYYWKIVDETSIFVVLDKVAEANVISSKDRTEILNALKLRARTNKPEDVGSNFIQFKKELINLKTGDRLIASPKYFVTNPCPYRLGKTEDTPKFDKLFNEWVKPENVKNLYEIIAYCLLPDYPIERIPCLLGAGANGKSTYLKILYTFLGLKNICSTSLEAISKSRFETTRLYKKLACILAETNLNSIENSQHIKKLVSGKDPVQIEFKNKGLTEFINYAKIIIATNNLPPTEDKTDGFYRRWLIIEFPNQFEKEIDVLADITDEEYQNLASKSLTMLYDLLKRRSFTNEGNIADRKIRYEEKSNPFDKFWVENIDDADPNSDITKHEFEKQVNEYMKENKVRTLSDRTIAKLMKDKGIEGDVVRKEWYENDQAVSRVVRCWRGIKWKI